MPNPPDERWIDILNSNGLATVLVFCGLIAIAAMFSALGVASAVVWRFLKPHLDRTFAKHDNLLDTLNDNVPKLTIASAAIQVATLETHAIVKDMDGKVDRLLEKPKLIVPP